VRETWCEAGTAASLRMLAQEFEQVRTILDKIDLLVKNIDALGDLEKGSYRNLLSEGDSSGIHCRNAPMAAIRPQPAHAQSGAPVAPQQVST
jgi:hypothetical protein